MSFKDQVAADINAIFLNTDEFAEVHNVEYKQILCVLDNDDSKIGGGKVLGVSEPQFRLFAKVEDLPRRKSPGNILNIDNTDYVIDNWAVDMGMAVITLKKTVAM